MLKAPGGGSSNIFGHYEEEEAGNKQRQRQVDVQKVENSLSQVRSERFPPSFSSSASHLPPFTLTRLHLRARLLSLQLSPSLHSYFGLVKLFGAGQ